MVDIPLSVIFHALSRGGRLSCVSVAPEELFMEKCRNFVSYFVLNSRKIPYTTPTLSKTPLFTHTIRSALKNYA